MTMDQTIERFCANHGVNTVNVMQKLEFVNSQWGMFVAWLIEEKRHNIKIVVEGGVVQDVSGLPAQWTYEVEDKD